MDLLTLLLIGGGIGLLIGFYLLRPRPPQIIYVPIEQEASHIGGGCGLLVVLTLLALVLLATPR